MVPARTRERQMTKAIQLPRIIRETEKAILVQVTTGRGNHVETWFPRSQVEIKGKALFIADWLLEKKSRELGGIITLDKSVVDQLIAA
jgi:hypothetical protein